MSGNRGFGRRASLVVAVLLAGCGGTMKPDANTGEDGERDGAELIKLKPMVKDPARSRGLAKGIVTYPGGDRVDWRLIELPEGRKGDLDLTLKWRPPRPGLDLSFKLFDADGDVIAAEGIGPGKRSRFGKKSTKLADVSGQIFVKVYASDEGDAGEYKLAVEFLDKTPAVAGPCDEAAPDEANPSCAEVIQRRKQAEAARVQREAERRADEEARIAEERAEAKRRADELAEKDRLSKKEAEEKAKLCPDPYKPDPADPRCIKHLGPCDPEKVDLENPRCFEDGVLWETTVKAAVKGDDGLTEMQINLGKVDGIQFGWTGYLVDADNLRIQNGEFTIKRVYDKYSVARLKASAATVNRSAKKVYIKPEVKP